jgi:SRSO17 transposase
MLDGWVRSSKSGVVEVASADIVDLVYRQPPVLSAAPASMVGIVEELAAYHAAFADCFPQRHQQHWLAVYLRGLLVADVPRKNVEAVALRLLGAGPAADREVRALQHFVSEGVWDDAAVLRQHWVLVAASLGDDEGVLTVDGSDMPKQGTHSAGVARQWCGALGKKANCQAGVFVGYASRHGYTLLDRRLYLPAQWFTLDYRDRWQAARIPAGTVFASKPALAASMVEAIVASKQLPARWLTCDEGYGDDPGFLDRVAACDLWYLAEVARSTHVWPLTGADGQPAGVLPTTWVPPTRSTKGPAPTRTRLQPDSPHAVAVEALATQVPAGAWQRYRILEGAKGPLLADFAALRVVAVREKLPGPSVWLLIRRSVPEPGDEPVTKFYLSNASADLPLLALVWASGMRWPIERCFTEGKDELGLDHYECRFWRGWHHHMTLVILAHHFLVRLQGQRNRGEGGPPTAPPAPPRTTGDDAGHHPAPPRPAGLAGPAASGARPLEPHADPTPPAGQPAATRLRPGHRVRPDRLSAAPQTSRLPVPPRPAPAPGLSHTSGHGPSATQPTAECCGATPR